MAERKKTNKPVESDKTIKVPILRIKKGDTLKTIHAKMQRAVTAADLQRFTETDEGIPGRTLLAELVALDREAKRKGQKKPKNGRSR